MSTLDHVINEPLTKITWTQLETVVAALDDHWDWRQRQWPAAGGGHCLSNTQCRA